MDRKEIDDVIFEITTYVFGRRTTMTPPSVKLLTDASAPREVALKRV